MKQLGCINPEGVTWEEAQNYPLREAVRAIVRDEDGKLALIYARNRHYYKLPGGGVEQDETHAQTLMRECREEIGCGIVIQNPIGCVEEWRKMFAQRQISYAYAAQVEGEKTAPTLMADEAADGFELQWVSVEEALALVTETKTNHPLARDYMMPRDVMLLQAYRDDVGA